jgi:1-acyl-sn-glycerol-3-phosphate acyltransferase
VADTGCFVARFHAKAMQRIVIDEPYEFVPPVYSNVWPTILRPILPHYLRSAHGVQAVESRHVERLRSSLAAGSSIILAPNHSRMSDPLVLGTMALEAGCYLYAMASWHAFKQSGFQTFMIRRMGAFSVLREGNDRRAVDTAIEILIARKRPLILFPEGAVTRHNDQLEELMDGPAFIARQTAKRLAKAGDTREVVIHPVDIRYSFNGDVVATLRPVLDVFEQQLSWQPQTNLSLIERINKIGSALLALKEVEYFGSPRAGNPFDRADQLIDEMLAKLEANWNIKDANGGVISRVKRLRTVILSGMIGSQLSPEEREHRWRDLAACYYVQQISHYPRDYLHRSGNLPERLIETMERFKEDFTDKLPSFSPFHSIVEIGEAIPVSSHRDRTSTVDPVMAEVRRQLETMIDKLARERAAALGIELRSPQSTSVA